MPTTAFFFVLVFGVAFHEVAGRSNGWRSSENSDEIIGGNVVDIKEYPHQAVLLFKSDHSLSCGGSIISDKHILTAGHCVGLNPSPERIVVRIGSTFWTKGGTVHDIKSIDVHPNASESGNYDVAILKTATKMVLNGETTKAVQLADADAKLSEGIDSVIVSGYGDTTGLGDVKNVLKAVELPVVNKDVCRYLYKILKVDIGTLFCAGFDAPGRSACYGDSGSPVIHSKNLRQYGIVSMGSPGCQMPHLPNAFTSIPDVRDWIKAITGI